MGKDIQVRTFKTEWFAKQAIKANILDSELCVAIQQVRAGQCDNLGGGVFKKRLGRNKYRSLIVAKGGQNWIFAFLFAKKNRENIDKNELEAFKELAELYAKKTLEDIEIELRSKALLEICHEEDDEEV